MVAFDPKNSEREEVIPLPFITLYDDAKTMHIITDYFRLVQVIDLVPLSNHLKQISQAFEVAKRKLINHNGTSASKGLEQKLELKLLELADELQLGLAFLPQARTCNLRHKRNVDEDEDVVNTQSLFPSVGRIFGFLTGTLSVDAGKYINNNRKNIIKLTKVSKNFTHLFNATLNIERKHQYQINSIKEHLNEMGNQIQAEINMQSQSLGYQSFLEELIFVTLDLQVTVEKIFTMTDVAETNRIGPLSRDLSFVKGIASLFRTDIANKKNLLYLLKIGSSISVESCHSVIKIIYKFPILRYDDLRVYKTVKMPHEVNGKYFTLNFIPHALAFGEQVYMFTKGDYDSCREYDKHTFCHQPSVVQELPENCIFMIYKNFPWEVILNKCQMTLLENPVDFIEFTKAHLIFFQSQLKVAEAVCPKDEEYEMTPLNMKGAGVYTIPTGCKVTLDNHQSYTFGKIDRSVILNFTLQEESFKVNLTQYVKSFKIVNKKWSDLWQDDTSDEEQTLAGDLGEAVEVLESITFTPRVVTFSLWTLLGYAVLSTIFIMCILYMICIPGGIARMHRCFCCGWCCCKHQKASQGMPPGEEC